MRWRTRRAVSGFESQISASSFLIIGPVISWAGRLLMCGATWDSSF